MLDGNAFQARGPAMEKALSVKRSRVCETMKLPHTLDRSQHSQHVQCSDRHTKLQGQVTWVLRHSEALNDSLNRKLLTVLSCGYTSNVQCHEGLTYHI